MTDLIDLDIALGAMLSNLAPAARKKVLRELSKELRNRQKKRITA
ncbi:phage virion morphogenesis protein, partial [Salmonella enterica]|nr:phage virion morphogenesis protein [Salmonella enterica]